MTERRCPGLVGPSAYLSAQELACPGCGCEVEIFGDEIKVRCQCGQHVFRNILPLCAKWCGEAKRCFGHVGSLPQALTNTSGADELRKYEERFREIQALVTTSLARCPHPENQQARRN